jgi:hypothetical protein
MATASLILTIGDTDGYDSVHNISTPPRSFFWEMVTVRFRLQQPRNYGVPFVQITCFISTFFELELKKI